MDHQNEHRGQYECLFITKAIIITMDPIENKKNAISYYQMAFEGNPREATELYVGNRYIQHNPVVKDGVEGFIQYFERMQREYPDKSVEFLRAVAEDDLVALHTHQTWPGDEHYVTMDIFRFDEKGKIIEHWDSIQKIPDESENDNGMY